MPSLFFFTDPERTPDPVASVERLPAGVGVVYRAFGRSDGLIIGHALRRVCSHRKLLLLVGADESLASAVDADGLHLPERMIADLRRVRARRPRWILTAAAHGLIAARRSAVAGADGIFVSPAFPSRSPSAGEPLGPYRVGAIARQTRAPTFALGGVAASTIWRLKGLGLAGAAAIEALA